MLVGGGGWCVYQVCASHVMYAAIEMGCQTFVTQCTVVHDTLGCDRDIMIHRAQGLDLMVN